MLLYASVEIIMEAFPYVKILAIQSFDELQQFSVLCKGCLKRLEESEISERQSFLPE